MATLTFPSRSQHNTGSLESARFALVAFFQGIQEGLEMANRYHALSRMSDEALAKHGLTRSDIPRFVLLGRAAV